MSLIFEAFWEGMPSGNITLSQIGEHSRKSWVVFLTQSGCGASGDRNRDAKADATSTPADRARREPASSPEFGVPGVLRRLVGGYSGSLGHQDKGVTPIPCKSDSRGLHGQTCTVPFIWWVERGYSLAELIPPCPHRVSPAPTHTSSLWEQNSVWIHTDPLTRFPKGGTTLTKAESFVGDFPPRTVTSFPV